jgi:ribosomal protein L32
VDRITRRSGKAGGDSITAAGGAYLLMRELSKCPNCGEPWTDNGPCKRCGYYKGNPQYRTPEYNPETPKRLAWQDIKDGTLAFLFFVLIGSIVVIVATIIGMGSNIDLLVQPWIWAYDDFPPLGPFFTAYAIWSGCVILAGFYNRPGARRE